ncbi:MAG: class B sortase [Oscillospiraceae bacterium]|jgi:sortase B|nr:class B sortase [Oscillospiraceae bacterium]
MALRKNPLRIVCALLLFAVFAVSAYQIFVLGKEADAQTQLRGDLQVYQPGAESAGTVQRAAKKNPKISQAQEEINPEIVGWLRIPQTAIDYLFVQGTDNIAYLARDVYGKSAKAGSIFMDYRCAGDFSDFNTILYGHNMKNGSMFRDIRRFADADFFRANTAGSLHLPETTLTLDIFAYLLIKADDAVLYRAGDQSMQEREDFLRYVKQNAKQYRALALSPEDRIVTLSTCSYEFSNARMVLLARLRSET